MCANRHFAPHEQYPFIQCLHLSVGHAKLGEEMVASCTTNSGVCEPPVLLSLPPPLAVLLAVEAAGEVAI